MSLEYNAAGLPHHMTQMNGATEVAERWFVWDGFSLVEERYSINGGAEKTRRLYGHGEEDDGTDLYYTRDHLGSVREVTDSSGTVQKRYDYTAYGSLSLLTGSAPASGLLTEGFTGHIHFQWQGMELVIAPYRIYDPRLGRWLSRDPIAEAGGHNLYQYADSNPVNAIDPDGMKVFWNPTTWLDPWVDSSHFLTGGKGALKGYYVGLGMYSAAFVDGFNPFGNPFESWGAYNTSCDDRAIWAQAVGEATYLIEDFLSMFLGGGGGGASKALTSVKGVKSAARATSSGVVRTGLKRGPKPKGVGPHNLTIERRIRELESEGMTHVGGGSLKEEFIRTPGGAKSARRPDITMRRPDGTLYRENVGRFDANGNPVRRELQALDDLGAELGERPGFTPYN